MKQLDDLVSPPYTCSATFGNINSALPGLHQSLSIYSNGICLSKLSHIHCARCCAMLSQRDWSFVQGLTVRNCDRDFLSSWVPTLLSGASSLTRADLDVEILPYLPAFRIKALKKLYLDACIKGTRYVPNVVQALKECQP